MWPSMRGEAVGVCAIGLVLMIVLASTSGAWAHAVGSPPITAKGSFVLTAAGTQNSTLHEYCSDMGLRLGPGDTLYFAWSANGGLGPPIHFEIHDHDPPTGYVLFYSVNVSADANNWTVPGSSAYMVYWVNLNDQNVTVTYAFEDIAPPASPWTFLIWVVSVGAIGLISLKLYPRMKKRREERDGTATPEGAEPPDESGPADSFAGDQAENR